MLVEEYDDEFEDMGMNIDIPDAMPCTEEEIAFGKALYELIQDLIDSASDTTVNEEFTSRESLKQHYGDHCLGDKSGRASTYTNIYYDFVNIDKFRIYENGISDAVINTEMVVSALEDKEKVEKYFRKLFTGHQAIRFALSCGFHNKKGPVSIGIHAYATDKTTNYTRGNTVNIVALTPKLKTITIYPVDAHYLERKFNNIIEEHSDRNIKYKFNND